MILAMPDSVQSQIVHKGRLFSVERLSLTDDGGRVVTREVIRHPGAVVVVPVLRRDALILIRNERIAVGETLWELPAGTLESGETPSSAAARELEEETGYRTSRLQPLGCFYSSPGFLDEIIHAFVADGLEHVGQSLDPGEKIEVHEIDRDAAVAMIADGRIKDGKTIAGILMWSRWSPERAS